MKKGKHSLYSKRKTVTKTKLMMAILAILMTLLYRCFSNGCRYSYMLYVPYIFIYIYIFRLFLIFPKIRARVTETGDVYHSRNTSTNLTQQIDELKLFKKNDLSIMKRPKCADIWFQLRCVPISCPRP